jgi:hypothetical protein
MMEFSDFHAQHSTWDSACDVVKNLGVFTSVVENCMLLSLLIYKIYRFVIDRNSEG